MVRRIYVEKKPGLRQEARGLLHELQTVVGVSALEDLRLLNRYDVEGLDEAAFCRAVGTVFSELRWTILPQPCPPGTASPSAWSPCRDSSTSGRTPPPSVFS